MDLRTLSLAALALGAAAPVGRPAPAPQGAAGALGPYLVETVPETATGAPGSRGGPALYVELCDLNALERDLRASGLGRLAGLLLPALEEHIPEQARADLEAHLGLDPAALVAGQVPWEDALARALITLAREHLGMEREEALRAVAALGTRLSVAADPGRGRAACSWSLRAGGRDALSDLFAELGAAAGARALLDQRAAGGGQLFGWPAGGGEEFFAVLRPDLLALCSDVEWATQLARAGDPARAAAGFSLAREQVLRSGAPLWAWLDGALLRAPGEDEQARARIAALGLDGVRSVELALAGDGGQLASRLRLRLAQGERRGLCALARGGRAHWDGLERLTADTYAVAGLARAPAELAGELAELIAGLPDAAQVRELWAEARRAPLLAELLTPGGGAGETLGFVRAGAAGLPMGYLALPAEPGVLARLERLRDGAQAFGGAARLCTKELEGSTCWLLAPDGNGLAVTHCDGTLIAGRSFLSLQDYLRQRAREDPELRAERIAEVRAALGRARDDSGAPAANLAGFVHVRTEPLFEAAWPWVLMGLSMAGAEGLEDLPDAFEIAEQVGDTTLLLFDHGEALELRGVGLLAGLGVLF